MSTVTRAQALAFVRDLDDVAGTHAPARRWFERCLERLQAQGPGSGLPDEEALSPENPSQTHPSRQRR